MPFCRNCGQELPSSAVFCPRCGAGASSTAGSQNEFDRIARDPRNQELWVRRLIAYLIDVVIVSIAVIIVSLIVFLIEGLSVAAFLAVYGGSALSLIPFYNSGALAIGGLSALFYILYFTFFDAYYHRTIGKRYLNLAVVTTDGSRLDLGKAFIRNLSKIQWILLVLDLLGGLFMHEVSSGQKFSDHVAHTNVVQSG